VHMQDEKGEMKRGMEWVRSVLAGMSGIEVGSWGQSDAGFDAGFWGIEYSLDGGKRMVMKFSEDDLIYCGRSDAETQARLQHRIENELSRNRRIAKRPGRFVRDEDWWLNCTCPEGNTWFRHGTEEVRLQVIGDQIYIERSTGRQLLEAEVACIACGQMFNQQSAWDPS